MEEITPEEFLESITGQVTNTTTDGHDVFMEFDDGRVIMFTSYGGNIVMCQMTTVPVVLQ